MCVLDLHAATETVIRVIWKLLFVILFLLKVQKLRDLEVERRPPEVNVVLIPRRNRFRGMNNAATVCSLSLLLLIILRHMFIVRINTKNQKLFKYKIEI